MNLPNNSNRCTVCQSENLRSSVSFGKQPPSNRFLPSGVESLAPEEFYPLNLGYCLQCDTLQLVDRMPIELVRPRYSWLVYNEPEEHLDDVVNKLTGLSNINTSSRFLGITYKDKSSLSRINRLGFPHTECISENDLQCSTEPFGLETIQEILSSEGTTKRLREIYGRSELILVRHIIEHASDASNLIRSLRGLLKPDGYMMFELPDSKKIFRANNHAFIWEEHISYFTEESVGQLAKAVDAEIVWLKQFPYPYENSLVALFQFSDVKKTSAAPQTPKSSASVLENFAKGFDTSSEEWREKLQAHYKKGEKVAVFGAGHLAVKFINFYNLRGLIDCVIDDNPDKIAMTMPGSDIEVVPSAELLLRGIRLCISTLNPESEKKVRGKLTRFFDAGGDFVPAFSTV